MNMFKPTAIIECTAFSVRNYYTQILIVPNKLFSWTEDNYFLLTNSFLNDLDLIE